MEMEWCWQQGRAISDEKKKRTDFISPKLKRSGEARPKDKTVS